MSQETNNAKRGSKRYRMEFSLAGLSCWGLGLFFLMGWIFALGVLVGRGLIPEGAKVLQDLRGQIAKLQDMVSRKDSQELERLRGPAEEYKFAFYEELVPPTDRTVKKEPPAKGEGKAQKKVSQAPAQTPAEGQKNVEYTVQVASLETEAEAAKIAGRLRSRGYSVQTSKATVKGKTYYRVQCGRFKNQTDAARLKSKLSQMEGVNGIIAKADSQGLTHGNSKGKD